MRASPSAKNSSKYDGEKNDENHECQHRNTKDEKILGPEDHSENDKPAVGNIEQQQRFAVHFDERECEKYQEVKDRKQGAQPVQSSFWFFRINKITFAFLAYRGN